MVFDEQIDKMTPHQREFYLRGRKILVSNKEDCYATMIFPVDKETWEKSLNQGESNPIQQQIARPNENNIRNDEEETYKTNKTEKDRGKGQKRSTVKESNKSLNKKKSEITPKPSTKSTSKKAAEITNKNSKGVSGKNTLKKQPSFLDSTSESESVNAPLKKINKKVVSSTPMPNFKKKVINSKNLKSTKSSDTKKRTNKVIESSSDEDVSSDDSESTIVISTQDSESETQTESDESEASYKPKKSRNNSGASKSKAAKKGESKDEVDLQKMLQKRDEINKQIKKARDQKKRQEKLKEEAEREKLRKLKEKENNKKEKEKERKRIEKLKMKEKKEREKEKEKEKKKIMAMATHSPAKRPKFSNIYPENRGKNSKIKEKDVQKTKDPDQRQEENSFARLLGVERKPSKDKDVARDLEMSSSDSDSSNSDSDDSQRELRRNDIPSTSQWVVSSNTIEDTPKVPKLKIKIKVGLGSKVTDCVIFFVQVTKILNLSTPCPFHKTPQPR